MLIEKVVLDYLKTELDTDNVYVEVPYPMPDEFVTIQTTGRGKENQINAVTLDIRSYAETKYEAAVLDEKVREAMEKIIELDNISSSKLGGGNDSPDTTTKRHRYRCFYNLFY